MVVITAMVGIKFFFIVACFYRLNMTTKIRNKWAAWFIHFVHLHLRGILSIVTLHLVVKVIDEGMAGVDALVGKN